MGRLTDSLKSLYQNSKSAKVGSTCKCPSCKTMFVKDNYQQAFCRSKNGTVCKDYYWNNVTPTKKNNKTRISPASAAYMEQRKLNYIRKYNPDDEMHPQDPYSLGQD